MVHPEQGNVPPASPDPVSPGPPPAAAPAQPVFPPGVASVPTQPAGYQETPYSLDYTGTPYAPAPRRRTGLTVGVGMVVAVIALAALVGIGYLAYAVVSNATASTPTRGTTPGPVNSTGAPVTTSKGVTPTQTVLPSTIFDGDLRTLLLARPSGAQPWSSLKDEDGKLTIDEVAKLFGDDNETRNDLQSFNFQRAAVMHWSQDKVFVLILVFQFDSTRNAGDYVAKTKKAGLKDFTAKGEFGGIGGSLLYVNETPNTQNQRTTIFISAQHEMVAYTTVWHPGEIDLEGATALAAAQHKRLP